MTILRLPLTVEFLGTPEAGKTTTVHRLEEVLSREYRTSIVQESAEIVPSIFPKGSMEAHFWMRLNTAQYLLENKVSKDSHDVLLIDRGIVDTLFWDYYYQNIGKLSSEQVKIARDFLKSIGISLPDLVVLMTTTPEEAIRRRGGEGRIVTMDFLKRFNHLLQSFIKTVSCPVFYLDTTGLSKDEVIDILLKKIYEL